MALEKGYGKLMLIWGNCLVKNEGRYLWFAVKSTIEFLDKILIWDTGSSDDTVAIIKLLQKEYPQKIEFKEIGGVDAKQFTKARQAMLDKSKCDWVFILDGDEVWWEDSMKSIIKKIKSNKELEYIVSPYYSVIGDIYHYQEELAGEYNLLGEKGHLNIRFVNKNIPDLHFEKPYGAEGFFDIEGKRIQDRDPNKAVFLDYPYLHFSNIQRSSFKKADSMVMQRNRKIRHEIGSKFTKDFKYPEVFYKEKPDLVPNPWIAMSNNYRIRAIVETPLRKLKRRIR